MKKIIYILIILLTACNQYSEPEVFDFSIQVNYPKIFKNGAPIAEVEILVRNTNTGREYKQITDNSGTANFIVRGGNYDMVLSFSEKLDVELEGFKVQKEILFNARKAGELILEGGLNFKLIIDYEIQNEKFIIKEQYTSGCRTPEGKAYGADKFIEIYNNSDKVLYSDGLCYGLVYAIKSYEPNPWVDANGNLLPRTPLWGYVAMVPGSGEEHPVNPGESIVLALSAINHKDDENGNPNSIDLSRADWEFYVKNGKYIDVPAVPNINMFMISYSSAMTFNTRGQTSILFRLPSKNANEIFTDSKHFMIVPGGTQNCFMVPHAWIIDGVENPRMDDRGAFKWLPASIDVGFIQYSGSYQKVSIKRKVKEVVNRRTIYQDTNNSTNDFLTNQEPTPGIIEKY